MGLGNFIKELKLLRDKKPPTKGISWELLDEYIEKYFFKEEGIE